MRFPWLRQMSHFLKQAALGDVAAIKLCYQKFEGWQEKKTLRFKGSIGIKRIPIEFVEPSVAKQLEYEKQEELE